MEEFQLSNFMKKGEQLLQEMRQELQDAKLDDSILPKTFSDEEVLKLVFVGQYSAGKSSIIKMLTGEDVAIGAKITTQTAAPYPWNGLEIVDTPGIHTELRPDHDELTYEQINHAALLVFVITNEGFSQRMGDHFRTLAIDQKRAANMVLVVNKMDRTALGNVPEQQAVIAEDLAKVTEPYKPKDLYLSFVDTNSYFEGIQEEDVELKEELLSLSGHDAFVGNLNRFVESHKLMAKAAKPLYTMADALRSVMNMSVGEDDADIDGLKTTIEHRKQLLLDGKTTCMDEVRDIANQCMNAIDKLGRDAAEQALNSGNQEKGNQILEDANNNIKQITEDFFAQINDCLKNSFEDVDKSLNEYNSSGFVQKVNANIGERIQSELSAGAIAPVGVLGTLGALTAQFGGGIAAPFAAQATQVVTSELGQNAGTIANWATTFLLAEEVGPLSKVAGSIVGDGIKGLFTTTVTAPPTLTNQVAKFVTGNAGKIGGALSVLGLAWTLYSMYTGNQKQKEQEAKQREARNQIVSGFGKVARDVGAHMILVVEQWMKDNVDPVLRDFDDSLKQIADGKNKSKVVNEKLENLLSRTENLIGEMTV